MPTITDAQISETAGEMLDNIKAIKGIKHATAVGYIIMGLQEAAKRIALMPSHLRTKEVREAIMTERHEWIARKLRKVDPKGELGEKALEADASMIINWISAQKKAASPS